MKKLPHLTFILVAVVAVMTIAPQARAQAGQATEATEIENPDVVLQVKGMVCKMCAYSMEKQLKKNEAVHEVQVLLDEQQVRLTFHDGKTVSEEALREAVLNAGFEVLKVTFVEKADRGAGHGGPGSF